MALLTKSRYMQALQCKKLFWLSLQKHPSLKPSDIQQFIFDQGHDVGFQAHELFPDGTLVDHHLPFMEKIALTRQLINSKETMFEGAFLWNKCYCQVDILTFNDNGWDLIEVKSSTSLKPTHIQDVAFQYFILTHLGIPINNAYVYVINTDYIRVQDINTPQLFSVCNITNDVKAKQTETHQKITECLEILHVDQSNHPIGPHCLSPYECSAIHHCWADIPNDSIFDISELSIHDKFSYYFNNQLLIAEHDPDQFSNQNQKRQIACYIEEKDFIDVQQLQSFLSCISYPMTFLDFECVQYAIPPYDYLSPYEQLPIQYSMHIEIDIGTITHHSFIAPYGDDPREKFLLSLFDHLPKSGSIIVYNALFEKKILTQLKALFPQYSSDIDAIIMRFIDLETPFKQHLLYFRAMNGKTSIKHVLPALVPELSYDQLTISSGRMINLMYDGLADSDDYQDIMRDLEAYGSLDTLAMQLILNKIKGLLNI